ncbi:hypothetical protein BH10PSE17_BH10PSE17_03040 [soil metagenome]
MRNSLYWLIAFVVSALAAPSMAPSAYRLPAQAAARAEPPAGLAAQLSEAADSPRAAMRAYFAAVRAGHWDEAARYLSLPPHLGGEGPRLARELKGVIDDHHWLELETVSPDALGRLDDGLSPELEEVYRLTFAGRVEAVRMIRTTDAQGPFWAFSPGTVERIDAWYRALPDHWLRETLDHLDADVLLLPGPFEFLWWQWVALVVLTIVAWSLGFLLGRGTRQVFGRLFTRSGAHWGKQLTASLYGPFVVAWALNLFWFGASFLVLTDPARQAISTVATAGMVVAVFWAVWSMAGVLVEQLLLRSWTQQNASTRTLVTVGGNLARGAIAFLGVLAMLEALGYPVGSLMAGLGIGGLAIAFGSQKAIENLFGSISLAVDQPFRVGDYVKIDDFTGTVENIGLRSTQIRTLDRTLVTMPNGVLAGHRIESYEARDRMRLLTTVRLRYDSTPVQVQAVLQGIESALRRHADIWPDTVLVRLAAFSESTLDIEVMAWFQVVTWAEFQRCRQEALIEFLRVVEASGTTMAYPTRTLRVEAREDS